MRRAAAAAALAAALAGPAAAEPGRTAAAFLQRTLGAGAAGMGSAFAAVTGRLDSLQYNPAGLAALERPTAASTYLKGFAGTGFGFLAYAHPTPVGTFSASALYYSAGDITLNLSDGTRDEVAAERDLAWSFGYALRPLPFLHLGAAYRFLRMDLAESAHATSSQGDFGGIVETPIKGLTLGAAYQYVGSDIRFEEAGDPPPKTWRYGAAYRLTGINPAALDPGVELQHFDATLAADMVQALHEERSPRVGIEMGLEPFYVSRVAVRFGWVFNRDSESFAFGMGFRQGSFGLDYAFSPADELGSLQHFTLSYRFGEPREP